VVECLPSKYKALSSEFQYHKKIFTKLNSKWQNQKKIFSE
jgi:hypothetical protein